MGNLKAPPAWLSSATSDRVMDGLDAAALTSKPIGTQPGKLAAIHTDAAAATLRQLGFNTNDIATLRGYAASVRAQRGA